MNEFTLPAGAHSQKTKKARKIIARKEHEIL
jgi:hypothetical protein